MTPAMIPRNEYAPIMPIALFEDFLCLVCTEEKHQREFVVGKYFLVLAHDVLAHPDRYANIFKNRLDIPKDSFVILDNSVIELGKPLDADSLLEAVHAVQPNCIVLPDVIGDAKESLRVASTACDVIERAAVDIPLMAVLQGRNAAELSWSLSMYARFPAVQYFGCPRWIANKLGTRQIFEPLLYLNAPVTTPVVHMLGMSSNLQDDIACASYRGVMGIDSANPIVLGQQHIRLDAALQYHHAPRTSGSFDFWKETLMTTETYENIVLMRRWLNANRQADNINSVFEERGLWI